MRIIGVTGGIGSGKSSVSRILEGFGGKIIDADIIARQIVQKGEKALEDIVHCFGQEILDKNGELNRKKLGDLVFGDSTKLQTLNDITHHFIAEKIISSVNENSTQKLIVIDAAIPISHGFLDTANEIWVVAADYDTRVQRIMARNQLCYDEAVKRIESQMKQDDYLKLADKVIYNNAGLDELGRNIESALIHAAGRNTF